MPESESRPVLDLVTARRWAMTARLMLAGAREQIDALNVFPVADGDTGTNMYLTMDGALDYVRGQFELGAGTESLQEGLALISRGMLLSARGNSGIILSQLTRGLAESVGPEVQAAGPEDIAAAFETAARTAWDALAQPVEGTILTVARAAAEGARGAVRRGRPAAGDGELEIGHVVTEALDAARLALARTPEQLPELGLAGVVDAGGAGLVLVVDALESVLQDRPPGAGQDVPDWWVLEPGATSARETQPVVAACPTGHASPDEGEGAVEVMYLLTGSDTERADRLRANLALLGTSVVVAGGPAEFRVHVHLDDPRLAVEAGSIAGVVSQVLLTSLADGTTLGGPGATAASPAAGVPAPTSGTGAQAPAALAVVACALGEGMARLFSDAGATVVSSGPRQRASAGQILAAVYACGVDRVVVLPNDSDTVMVARAAARQATERGVRVDVVPTRSLVAGVAAVAVLDPDADPDGTVEAMGVAADAVRSGALTTAERAVQTPVGPCTPGQWLGIVEDRIVAVDDELAPVAGMVADRLLADGAEIVTVLLGHDADDRVAAVVAEAVSGRGGDGALHTPEIQTVRGDQPTYPVLLGVE